MTGATMKSVSSFDDRASLAQDLARQAFGRLAAIELRALAIDGGLWHAAAVVNDERQEWAHGRSPAAALESLVERLSRGVATSAATLADLERRRACAS